MRAIDTDHLAEKLDREQRRKVMADARRAQQKRPVTYATTRLVPEGVDRLEVAS
jgi:hypothetical protein